MSVADARAFLLMMAARRLGSHLYIWGGETIHEGGFDCSGFASSMLAEAARSWPRLYDGRRRTAAGLHAYYRQRACREVGLESLLPGGFAFYRFPGRHIHHVAIHAAMVPDTRLPAGTYPVGPIAIEAGGSGSRATSPRRALETSAGVRLTATDRQLRGVEVVYLDPFQVLEPAAA